MYHNLSELQSTAELRNVPIWRIVLENEMKLTDRTEEAIMEKLRKNFHVMEKSVAKALSQPLPAFGNLICGVSALQNAFAQTDDSLCGRFLNRVMALALSCSEVNASMGKICAAPTAGSCGILPAVLIGLREKLQLSEEQTLHGLLTASGVGAVIMENATVSGATGGCQVECGAAAAIAAAAAVGMAGGTPDAAIHASGLALMNAMGLVCDPVAGLVQVPCAQRNASQAVNAIWLWQACAASFRRMRSSMRCTGLER